jgi:hypothetical protein
MSLRGHADGLQSSSSQVLQNLGVLEMLRKKRKEGDPDVSPRAALAAFASLGVAFVLGVCLDCCVGVLGETETGPGRNLRL